MSKSANRFSVNTTPRTPYTPASLNKKQGTGRNGAAAKSLTNFEFLLKFETHFLIDDSQLMFGDNWQEAKEALLAAALYCTKHNADGFSVSFLHHESPATSSAVRDYTGIRSEDAVQDIFKTVRTASGNSKPTGQRLKKVLDEHLVTPDNILQDQNQDQDQAQKLLIESKPLKVIIITDGMPTDDILSVLAPTKSKAALHQPHPNPPRVSIEFWQVGRNALASHFFYKTGMLRPMPSLSPEDSSSSSQASSQKWKYDPDDPKKAGPSTNFVKFMFFNLINSRFMRTSW